MVILQLAPYLIIVKHINWSAVFPFSDWLYIRHIRVIRRRIIFHFWHSCTFTSLWHSDNHQSYSAVLIISIVLCCTLSNTAIFAGLLRSLHFFLVYRNSLSCSAISGLIHRLQCCVTTLTFCTHFLIHSVCCNVMSSMLCFSLTNHFSYKSLKLDCQNCAYLGRWCAA